MSNRVILEATYASLEKLVAAFLEAIDGIPDDDLNTWKPSAEQQGGGEMNTLGAMSVHTAQAATWRIVHQIFGQNYPRDREAEFSASASREEIDERFGTLLSKFAELIEADPDVDLTSLPPTIHVDHPDRTRMDWLVSTIDHTALHLGHAEIHRQLWLAERAGSR